MAKCTVTLRRPVAGRSGKVRSGGGRVNHLSQASALAPSPSLACLAQSSPLISARCVLIISAGP